MYIKKELLIDAFKIEYEHYFKKNNFFRIIIKIIKDNFFYFILSNNHKELDISKYHKIIFNFNKSIQMQMDKSINLVFSKKDTCVLEFYSDRNINTNKNFNSYNLFNFIKITKKEILINLISSMINIVKFLFKNITKEDLFYKTNKLFYKSFLLLSEKILVNIDSIVVNFDDADSKIRILNKSLFNKNKKISIQQGLILENSLEYFYPSSDIFLVYGDYFKEKLINYFKFEKKIISLGVFELISDEKTSQINNNKNYEYTYISQPYVKSLFNNYLDKINLDRTVSQIFDHKTIIRKFHPFEGIFIKILNLIFFSNYIKSNLPIIEIIKQSENIITLSSTAAFFGILYKKNIIAIKYKYSNYFDEFLTNKYLKFVDNKKYKMITIENIDCIDYFFSGDIEEQRSNFNKFFNE